MATGPHKWFWAWLYKNFILSRATRPDPFPVAVGALSVVMPINWYHFKLLLSIASPTASNISQPLVPSYELARARSSSETCNLFVTPRRKIRSCAVEPRSVYPSRASDTEINFCALLWSWSWRSSPIYSTLRVIVIRAKLTTLYLLSASRFWKIHLLWKVFLV